MQRRSLIVAVAAVALTCAAGAIALARSRLDDRSGVGIDAAGNASEGQHEASSPSGSAGGLGSLAASTGASSSSQSGGTGGPAEGPSHPAAPSSADESSAGGGPNSGGTATEADRPSGGSGGEVTSAEPGSPTTPGVDPSPRDGDTSPAFRCTARFEHGQLPVVSWVERSGDETAARVVNQVATNFDILISVDNGLEFFRDTEAPLGTPFGYRVATRSGARADCTNVGGGDSSQPHDLGSAVMFEHPCGGRQGGPAPPIEPAPDMLQGRVFIMEGRTIGLPNAVVVCGGIGPDLYEALRELAPTVIEVPDRALLTVVPSEMLVNGAIVDADGDPLPVSVEMEPSMPADGLGDVLLQLLRTNERAAATVLASADQTALDRIDPQIMIELRDLPPALGDEFDLPAISAP